MEASDYKIQDKKPSRKGTINDWLETGQYSNSVVYFPGFHIHTEVQWSDGILYMRVCWKKSVCRAKDFTVYIMNIL